MFRIPLGAVIRVYYYVCGGGLTWKISEYPEEFSLTPFTVRNVSIDRSTPGHSGLDAEI